MPTVDDLMHRYEDLEQARLQPPELSLKPPVLQKN